MTYFNRIKEVEIELPNFHNSLDGLFELETFKGVEFPKGSGIVFEFAGTRRKRGFAHKNLITDTGLEFYGTEVDNHAGYCHVGTGNTPPTNGDSSLGNWVDDQVNTSSSYGVTNTVPYYGWIRMGYRFPAGFAGGAVNLNEIGVSPDPGSSAPLSSRALTVDDQGTPITVSVLADEYLDVFYTRRNFPGYVDQVTGNPVDGTGTIDISGTSYNYTTRPGFMGNNAWGAGALTWVKASSGWNYNTFNSAAAYEATATLGAITGTCSGAYGVDSASDNETYTPFSNERSMWYQWGLDNGNVTGGIGGVSTKSTIGFYQVVFNNPVPKDNTKIFTYYHKISWSRN